MTDSSATEKSTAERPATGQQRLTIALHQHVPTPMDIPTSLVRIDQQAGIAASQGADLLIVPEASLTGYNIAPDDAGEIALPAQGDVLGQVAESAARHRIAIAIPHIERDHDTLYNAVQLIDDEGNTLVRYRKTHLWGDLDRSLFAPGEDLAPVIGWRGWRIGLLICYDVEFPEAVRRLALEGADLVLVPTALMKPYTFVADHMVRVRAAENGVFIAYANYCGSENGLDYTGHSAVIGPAGDLLAQAAETPVLLQAELDQVAIVSARNSLPYLSERRNELYAPR